MADVRSLLKAKRQEARISHPYATYTPSEQLKCIVCVTIVKHASAWEGHLGSKAHRINVARIRQEELAAAQRDHEASLQQQQQQSEQQLGGVPYKRKAVETIAPSPTPGKQKKAKLSTNQPAPIPTTSSSSSSSGFPADFFSDPNREIPLPEEDEDEDEVEEQDSNAMTVDSEAVSTQPNTAIDEEYEAFQKAMLAEPPRQNPAETFAQATFSAEPEIYTEEQISGYSGATSASSRPADSTTTQTTIPLTEEKSAEAKRKAKELDERELIMDRLLEEERIQEEADMRVAVMKNRLDALKKKREARKAGKAQQPHNPR